MKLAHSQDRLLNQTNPEVTIDEHRIPWNQKCSDARVWVGHRRHDGLLTADIKRDEARRPEQIPREALDTGEVDDERLM